MRNAYLPALVHMFFVYFFLISSKNSSSQSVTERLYRFIAHRNLKCAVTGPTEIHTGVPVPAHCRDGGITRGLLVPMSEQNN